MFSFGHPQGSNGSNGGQRPQGGSGNPFQGFSFSNNGNGGQPQGVSNNGNGGQPQRGFTFGASSNSGSGSQRQSGIANPFGNPFVFQQQPQSSNSPQFHPPPQPAPSSAKANDKDNTSATDQNISNSSNNNSSSSNNNLGSKAKYELSVARDDCFVTQKYGALRAVGINGIISSFQKACRDKRFVDKCKGFDQPSFLPNYQLVPGVPAVQKFQEAIKGLPDHAELGLVFHGTPGHNIQAICKDGLDKNKRSGQSYGPGEYFSKDPGVSVSYCRGGNQMLVFVVVLPSSLSGNTNPNAAARPYHQAPAAFVVVDNNNHQLPIGVLTFANVSHEVMMNSQQLRNKMMSLNKQVEDRIREAEEAQLKAEIIQSLIAMHVDVASANYIEYRDKLSDLSQKEISWYVQRAVGDDPRFASYFPGLPEPMDSTTLAHTMVQSVDYAMAHESQAKYQLEQAQKALTKQQDQEKQMEGALMPPASKGKTKDAKGSPKRPRDSAKITADIMQNLVTHRMDIASELYNRRGSVLDAFAKREIAQCVHRVVDDPDLVPVLFPDLPDVKKPCGSSAA